jgi:Tfp pilus assembly protein PilF
LRAFERATKLDPTSVHAHCEHAYVLQKVGQLDEAILGFQHTLELAKEQGIEQYIPALVGLSETCLEHAKEDYQQGFFGRAADRCSHVIQTALHGLTVDPSILTFWKLVGDACYFFRIIPSYIHLCDYASLQSVIKLTSQPHEQLKLPADLTTHWINEFLALDDVASDFSLPPKVALDAILSCAANAFKQVIVLCKNHQAIAPAFWNDMGLVYYTMYRNGAQDEVLVAMQCIKVALKLDPTEYLYWNSLGVIASASGAPKVAQYAFIKAIEYNSKSAIPWTNYGFLCLSCQDYELANQAFETAHSLDPEWISAWVGQAHVASLWGTDSADIFEHAFESSNGSSVKFLDCIQTKLGH